MPTYRSDLDAIPTYSPGKPIDEVSRELGIEDIAKLASNESPTEPFPEVQAVIAQAAAEANRYPEDSGYYLVNALAERHGVEPSQIWLGHGSTQILACAALGVGEPGTSAVFGSPSFVMYPICAMHAGIEPIAVPNDDQWRLDLGAMADGIRDDTRIVYVCNPNNPTGTYRSGTDVAAFIDAVPREVMVVIDEAYHDYVTAPDYASALPIAVERDNVIVTRTFSKIFGLAGLRIGYGVAGEETITSLRRTQHPFSASSIGQAAALEAIAHDDQVLERLEANTAGRAQIEAGLAERGIEHAPSQANFIAMKTADDPNDLTDRLLMEGVIVRPIGSLIRVTVGTEDENRRFLKALDDVGVTP